MRSNKFTDDIPNNPYIPEIVHDLKTFGINDPTRNTGYLRFTSRDLVGWTTSHAKEVKDCIEAQDTRSQLMAEMKKQGLPSVDGKTLPNLKSNIRRF